MFNKIFPILVILMILSPFVVGGYYAATIFVPSHQNQQVVVQPAPISSVQPITVPNSTPSQPASQAYYAQFAEVNTASEAQTALQNASDMSVILDHQFDVLKLKIVKLNNKFKVVLPEPSQDAEQSQCDDITGIGQVCTVVKF